MKIAVIDYGSGNVRSVIHAFERLGVTPVLTSAADELRKADKVVFPGVGEASSAMKALKASGLDSVIPSLKQPVLGICLGMQLMCRRSEEGDTVCLGIFDQEVKRFRGDAKVPQVGWNTVSGMKGPLFEGLADNSYMYFVHGYYASLSECTAAATDYLGMYSSALAKDRFFGVQFHPEKSGASGERLLKNFLEL